MQAVSILYVEDNDDLRVAIGSLLGAGGYELVACESGEAALTLMQARAFDVLITDVSLPGMSGTELARHWLRDDPNRWVVLCSGYDFGDQLRRLGPRVRSLSKPFEPDELESLMREVNTTREREYGAKPQPR